MPRPLEGAVAIVTGASSGIGLAFARRAVKAGASVGLIARDAGRLERARETLLALPGVSADQVALAAADVSMEEAITVACASLERTLGPATLLINNAGAVGRARVAEHPTELWDRLMAVNLRGVFLCTRCLLPGMIARGRGRILNVASISGTLGTPALSAYCASKWGVLGFTRSLGEELRGSGVFTAAVAPGSVDTPMLQAGLPGALPAMSADDVAGTLFYLATEAPLAMQGSCLQVFGDTTPFAQPSSAEQPKAASLPKTVPAVSFSEQTAQLPPSAQAGADACSSISLSGLRFEGRHGYFREEREAPRPIELDLEVGFDVKRASHSDELEDTLDYNRLAACAGEVITGRSFKLIERLAGAIADALLTSEPALSWVQVTVYKPSPKVEGSPSAASVRLKRQRLIHPS